MMRCVGLYGCSKYGVSSMVSLLFDQLFRFSIDMTMVIIDSVVAFGSSRWCSGRVSVDPVAGPTERRGRIFFIFLRE